MGKLFLIHFSPLELYPPVQNLLRIIAEQEPKQTIKVLTTWPDYKELNLFKPPADFIKIRRLGVSGSVKARWRRLYYYLRFYVTSCWLLIKERPQTILYYETISALPAYLYKRFINRKAKIMVHYHEYTTPEEYATGMYLTKQFHKAEYWLYPRLSWLSHTNSSRLQLFLKDIQLTKVNSAYVVPNFPPAKWYRAPWETRVAPLKLVYVGALSLDDMYTREIATWVASQAGAVTLDFYAYNITDEATRYLESLNDAGIRLHGGIDYEDLPEVVAAYHVGLILYKGHSMNYVFNAPNKLFEYLVLGLDVWYPSGLQGIYGYDNDKSAPRVLRMNFEQLKNIELESVKQRPITNNVAKVYSCETAFETMIKTFLS